MLARPIALPYMSSVGVYFIVEGMEDGNLVVSMLVDGIRETNEAEAVTCAIFATAMLPARRYKKIRMDCPKTFSTVGSRLDGMHFGWRTHGGAC